MFYEAALAAHHVEAVEPCGKWNEDARKVGWNALSLAFVSDADGGKQCKDTGMVYPFMLSYIRSTDVISVHLSSHYRLEIVTTC